MLPPRLLLTLSWSDHHLAARTSKALDRPSMAEPRRALSPIKLVILSSRMKCCLVEPMIVLIALHAVLFAFAWRVSSFSCRELDESGILVAMIGIGIVWIHDAL